MTRKQVHLNCKRRKTGDLSLLSLVCPLLSLRARTAFSLPSPAFSLSRSSVCLLRKHEEKRVKFLFFRSWKCLGWWSIFQAFLKRFFPHTKASERGARERGFERVSPLRHGIREHRHLPRCRLMVVQVPALHRLRVLHSGGLGINGTAFDDDEDVDDIEGLRHRTGPSRRVW